MRVIITLYSQQFQMLPKFYPKPNNLLVETAKIERFVLSDFQITVRCILTKE